MSSDDRWVRALAEVEKQSREEHEAAIRADERAKVEAEVVAMCRTRAPAPGYVTSAVAAAVNAVVADCVERGEYRARPRNSDDG